MNITKPFLLCCTCFILMTTNTRAVDMEVLQEQCADIGFKIRTPANGKCVLRLMKSVKAEEKAVEANEQTYANQQAVIAAQAQQAEDLRQQQAQMLQLQRDSIAAQQQAAQAQTDAATDQRRSNGLKLMNQGLDRMTGTGAYAPTRNSTSTCVKNGNTLSCF